MAEAAQSTEPLGSALPAHAPGSPLTVTTNWDFVLIMPANRKSSISQGSHCFVALHGSEDHHTSSGTMCSGLTNRTGWIIKNDFTIILLSRAVTVVFFAHNMDCIVKGGGTCSVVPLH